jgi:hypothetical protein
MRYMLHLFSIAFAILFSPVAFVFRLAVETYQPTAAEIIEADTIARTAEIIPIQRSRHMSFIERAKAHVDFTAGHFDPGRLAA